MRSRQVFEVANAWHRRRRPSLRLLLAQKSQVAANKIAAIDKNAEKLITKKTCDRKKKKKKKNCTKRIYTALGLSVSRQNSKYVQGVFFSLADLLYPS